MLKIKSKNMMAFVINYNNDIIKSMLKFIPDIVLNETDDKNALIKRIIQNNKVNGTLTKMFKHHSDNKTIDDSDIDAFAQFLLINAKQIPLKKPILDKRMEFEDGHFKHKTLIIPQINIQWVKQSNKLKCELLYVEGDKELIGSYPIA